jgi:hypothetical protein
MPLLEDITQAGRGVGQGLLDVLNTITSPVMPVLEQIPQIAAQYQALQGNPAVLQMMQQQQQQDLMKQLVQQQMQGIQQDQINPQIQTALATKDYSTASKLLSQQQQRDKFVNSIQKDSLLTPQHKQILLDSLSSGVDVKSAADLRARLTLGSEAVKRKLEEQTKKPEEAAKITTAQLQAKQALEITPEKIVDILKVNQPSLNPEDLKKAAYGEMVNKKLFTGDKGKKDFERFWEGQQIVGNVPKTPGFLDKFMGMLGAGQSQPQQQPKQQQQPVQQPQVQVLISPSTGRKFIKSPDGKITEIQ